MHPERAWQSGLMLPAGALAETFPRTIATASTATASTNVYLAAIPLDAGVIVSNITVAVVSPESGGTHGFLALLDSGLVCRATSVDLTGGAVFAPAGAVTVAMTAPYTVPSAGVYYIAFNVTATGIPNMVFAVASTFSGTNVSPRLSGIAGTTSTVPTVGSTTFAFTSNAPPIYGYVS
jgi:hypothetical protein